MFGPGPLLFNAKDKKIHYIPGVKAVLGIFCALVGVIGIQVGILFSLNKVRQRQRVANGKPQFIKDTSMDDKYTSCGQDEGNVLGQNGESEFEPTLAGYSFPD